jgi:hypothetical protein
MVEELGLVAAAEGIEGNGSRDIGWFAALFYCFYQLPIALEFGSTQGVPLLRYYFAFLHD